MTKDLELVKKALRGLMATHGDGCRNPQECPAIADGSTAFAALERMGYAHDRPLNVARGCHDYGGGYKDAREAEIYHHGIQTVIQALEAAVVAPDALQVRVLESIGATSRESTALTPSEER